MDDTVGRPRLIFGVPRLDTQHEQLEQLVREINAAFEQKRPVCELRRLAAVLTLHTRLHFMDEEIFMEGAGYPGLVAHRHRHAEFTEGLLRLQSGLFSTKLEQFASLVEYEMRWIQQHLEEEDGEMRRWLSENELFNQCDGWERESNGSSIPTSRL